MSKKNDKHLGLLVGNFSNLLIIKTKEESLRFIQEVLDDFEQFLTNYTFASGLSGIAWCICYTIQKFDIKNQEEVLESFDDAISNFVHLELKKANYDFLHYSLGGVLYFIQRRNVSEIEKALDLLLNNSVKYNEFDVWLDNSDKEFENDNKIDLSLSHGLASIIAICNIGISEKILENRFKNILDNTINLYKSILNVKSFNEFFPTTILNNEILFFPKRLAWCYGDLGVMYQLLWSSILLNDIVFKNKLLILLSKLAMYSTKEANIRDACFCHGSSGIAYIFYKIYMLTKIELFYKASQKWLKLGNAILKKTNYKFYNSIEFWHNSNDLLTGMNGVLIVKKTIKGEINSNWDRCLLLS